MGTDQYNRLLRYVSLADGRFVNEEMVHQRFAIANAYPPDTRHQDLLESIRQEAQAQEVGLWGPTPTLRPRPSPTPTEPPPTPVSTQPATTVPQPIATSTESPQNCHPSYRDVCIPPAPPDLDCGDIPHRRFRGLPSNPHRFDGDHDGVGCESG